MSICTKIFIFHTSFPIIMAQVYLKKDIEISIPDSAFEYARTSKKNQTKIV